MPEHNVVICTGDYNFALSDAAKTVYDALAKQRGLPPHNWEADPELWHLDRHDPVLVEVVVLLGKSAHRFPDYEPADLQVVQLPGNRYYIARQSDGDETVLTPEGDHWTVIE
jgi:hypothetical protein